MSMNPQQNHSDQVLVEGEHNDYDDARGRVVRRPLEIVDPDFIGQSYGHATSQTPH